VKLVHLVGFIIKKFVMTHCHMNVKLDGTCNGRVKNDKNLQNLGWKMEGKRPVKKTRRKRLKSI